MTLADYDRPYLGKPIVEISYLPPCWATDKLLVWMAVLNGGRVGFADNNIARVFDAFKAIAPTVVVGLPAVGQALRSEYQACYDKVCGNDECLFRLCHV